MLCVAQVSFQAPDDNFYLTRASGNIPPDPGYVNNPEYLEGLSRASQFLDATAVKELMSPKSSD